MSSKIPYGYQIENGKLTVQHQEAENVKRIFSLYLEGMSQQQIVDALNAGTLHDGAECLVWTPKRLVGALGNPCYVGKGGYPPLINADIFRTAQEMRKKRRRTWGDHPALCLVKKLRCDHCGHSLRRSAQRQWRNTLRLLCDGCGARITITDAALLAEVERQAAEYEPSPANAVPYTPSEDTVRLTNAINRGLEHPEHPEDVVSLILQGISARYDCFPAQMTSTDLLCLIKEKDFDQAIQYITISADNAVTVDFK